MVGLQVAAVSPHQHALAKVDKLVEAFHEAVLRRNINDRAVSVDGMPLVWAARRFGKGLTERVAGGNLFEDRVERAVQRDRRVFLPGAHDDTPPRRTGTAVCHQVQPRALRLSDP